MPDGAIQVSPPQGDRNQKFTRNPSVDPKTGSWLLVAVEMPLVSVIDSVSA
jgi:hypothetical protein